MNIGFCGLGKLGTPVALAIEGRGHKVIGCDPSPSVQEQFRTRKMNYREEGATYALSTSDIQLVTPEQLVAGSEIIFVAVQTPHEPRFEGATPMPDFDRADFDYTYLKNAIALLAVEAARQDKATIIAVISTCLPGTFKREVEPLLNAYISYVYSPQYIAMGTAMHDFLHPEFALVGVRDEYAEKTLEHFYGTIHNAPVFKTDIATAEGIKVFYNTFITSKIILANAWMQVAHNTGMNVDHISECLSLANRRLLSPAYMRGGGPDAGGCHPRDLIALSWLGRQIGMQPNVFDLMVETREAQTDWTVDLVVREHLETGLPVYVLGKTFKPETNITTGSGATLFCSLLNRRGIDCVQYDPFVDSNPPVFERGIYFVATQHDCFRHFLFPAGSIVFDLWRYLHPQHGVKLIPIGTGV